MINKVYILALMLVLGVSTLYAQPKIEIIGGDTYDWDKVKPAESPLKAKIKIKNTGNETLKISEVTPGCGCTTAPLDKKELAPNEIATMDVSLTVSPSPGKVVKSITIKSNDPEKPKKLVYLKAEVVKAIATSPTSYFTFVDAVVGKVATSKLMLKNTSNQDITFSDFSITPATATINQKNKFTLKPGQEIELEAKYKPEKAGHFNIMLKMKTTHSDSPEMQIQGYGSVKESAVFNNN